MTDTRKLEELAERSDEVTFVQCGCRVECEHEFTGWREFDDGLGGEAVCAKCGTGAFDWSMRFLP